MGRPFLDALALATAALVACPAAPLMAVGIDSSGLDNSATLLARGGGGGGGGRGGGGRGGGGGGRAHTGFSGGGSLSRGDRKPSGGFSSGDRVNRVGNPSINRPANRGEGLGDRSFNREGDRTLNREGDRTFNRNGDRNLNLDRGNRSINVDRDWNREVNIGDINLHPGWARPGWGVARPWNWGWYGGWSNPPWGWWGASAAAWGVGTLATAAIINDAVNNAVTNDVTYIVVPNTGYQLEYGTIQPYGNYSVSFVVTANGTSYQLTADCNAGTINDREPSSSQEAEVLNAACQVAYGQAS